MEIERIENLKIRIENNKLFVSGEKHDTLYGDTEKPYLSLSYVKENNELLFNCTAIIKCENTYLIYKISTNEEIERFFENFDIISSPNLNSRLNHSEITRILFSNLSVQTQIQNTYISLTFLKILHECSANIKNCILLAIDSSNGLIPFSAAIYGANSVHILDLIENNANYMRLLAGQTNFRDIIRVMNSKDDNTANVNRIVCDTLCYRFLKDDTLMRFIRAKNNSAKNCLLFPCACDVNVVAFNDCLNLNNDKLDVKQLENPIVGHIDYEKIMASSAPHIINFEKLTVSDVNQIQIPFTFTMNTDCDLQGIALWFDFIFYCPGKKFILSTSPQQKIPEWDQKIYLFPRRFQVRKNETLTGKIRFVLENSIYTSKLVINNIDKISITEASFLNKTAYIRHKPEMDNQSTSSWNPFTNLFNSNSHKELDINTSVKQSEFKLNNWEKSLQKNVKKCEAFIFCDNGLKDKERDKLLNNFKNIETTSGKINVLTLELEDAFQFNDMMLIIINENYFCKEIKTKTITYPKIKQCFVESLNIYMTEIQTHIRNGKFCTEMNNISEIKVIKYFEKEIKSERLSKVRKYILKIKKYIIELNKDYEEANEIIANYRQNWIKKFENCNYMTSADLKTYNISVIKLLFIKVKKIKNKKIKRFIITIWDEILYAYSNLNNTYNIDNQFDNCIIKPAETLIIKRVNELSKCGFFSRNEIKAIFNKVFNQFIIKLEYFIIFKGFEGVTQSHFVKLIETVEKKFLTSDLLNICESYERAINLLNKARKDSLKIYTEELESTITAKGVDTIQTLENLHEKCKNLAFEYHNKRTLEIRNIFEESVFQKININNYKTLESQTVKEKFKYEKEYLNIDSTRNQNKQINIKSESIIRENQTYSPYFAIYYGLKKIIYGYLKDEAIIQNTNTDSDNSIALNNNKVYFGIDNDAEYEKLKLNSTDISLSIHDLLIEKMKKFSTAELRQYRIKYEINDEILSANSVTLSMESLIALQILKTKHEAEQELQQNLSNLVFTIPSYFGLSEINFLNNIAKLIDLESITYLSEINALAIQYCFDRYKLATNELKLVFIIVVNEIQFDSVLCIIGKDCIRQISYSHIVLANQWTLKTMVEPLFKTIFSFSETKTMINKAFNLMKNDKKAIDNVLIAGYSQFKEDIIQMSTLCFPLSYVSLLNHTDIINGAVLYSHFISNRIDCRIIGIARETIEIVFRYTHRANDCKHLIKKNQEFLNIKYEFNVINFHFPLEIFIRERGLNILHYKIPAEKNYCMHNFEVRLISNEIIEIDYTIDKKMKRYINNYKVDTDGKDALIFQEKRKVETYGKQMKEKYESFKKSQQQNCSLKNELNSLYNQIKKLVENSKNISRVKKLSYLETLGNVLKVLNSSEAKAEDYEKQIISLKSLLDLINY